MKTAVIALTTNGAKLALKIGSLLQAEVFSKHEMQGAICFDEPVSMLFRKLFKTHEGIICIMATGIVVRSIAPLLKGKDKDPAVVVCDEGGQFAISLLSGHLGGANDLAKKVAQVIGAVPVITTATDVNGILAPDEYAKKNGFAIENLKCLPQVSSALLEHQPVAFYSTVHPIEKLEGTMPPNEHTKIGIAVTNKLENPFPSIEFLWLRPKNLSVGIGCKKNTSMDAIEQAVAHFLQINDYSQLSIKCVVSIDLKKEEQGILAFCQKHAVDFITYPPNVLEKFEESTQSDFVKAITGTGSVCEASVLALGATLLVKKTVYQGITLALGEYSIEGQFAR